MLSLRWHPLADLASPCCCQVPLRLSEPDSGSPRFQMVTEMQAGQELFHDPLSISWPAAHIWLRQLGVAELPGGTKTAFLTPNEFHNVALVHPYRPLHQSCPYLLIALVYLPEGLLHTAPG